MGDYSRGYCIKGDTRSLVYSSYAYGVLVLGVS